MSYCGPRGIEWFEFLRWHPLSRAAAIAWSRRQSATCSSCGTHPDVWDPERGGDSHALVADIRSCRGCETVRQGDQQMTEAQRKAGGFVALAPPPPASTGGSS